MKLRKILLVILLLPFCLRGEEIEVSLATKTHLKPLYLNVPSSTEYSARYLEELRSVFVYDLSHNGFTSVLEPQASFEASLKKGDLRGNFDVALWKREQIPYVLGIQIVQGRLQLIAIDVGKGSSKKYGELPLTGNLDEDRKKVHRLTDAVQKDLFGMEGIASLQLLYTKRCPAGSDFSSEIWVCDSDGANARPVLSDKGYCVLPGFFPKQVSSDSGFYYVSDKEGQSKIYRSSLKTPKSELMLSMSGSQSLATLNVRGNQMAFISDIAGRPDLFLQNLDTHGNPEGKARQLFSASRATQASPTFSPDGKRLAFVSDKDGPPRIYILDIPGGKNTKRPVPRLLTKKNRENTSPSWSPDGTKLAYSAKVDGIRQIWIYDFTNEEEVQLTSGPDIKENPAWAPDSLHLVYNTENHETCELYCIDIQSKQPTLISKGFGQKRFACWEPR